MTRNMTRKGLALGAASALLISGFSALPASLADTHPVSLAPTTGTEYGMNAADGVTFSMTSNEAGTTNAGNLKFLVTDSSGVVVPSGLSTGGDTDAIAIGDWLDADANTNAVTFTTAGVANGAYKMWVDEDLVINAATNQTVLAKDTIVQVSVNDDIGLFLSPIDITSPDSNAFVTGVNVNFFATGDAVETEDDIADAATDFVSIVDATQIVSLDVDGIADGTYFMYSQEALILDTTGTSADPITALALGAIVEATVASNVVAFKSEQALTSAVQDGLNGTPDLVFVEKASMSTVIRHAANDTYVVDSGVSDGGTSESLVLVNDETTSRSVTVQAWMDVNNDNVLDSNDEDASPLRTVTWTKPSEIVTATTMSPIVGDSKLTAVITTTPVLNGNQVLVQDNVFVNAAFTRSLSTSAAVYADNTDTSNGQGTTSSVWNDTDKTFTVEVNTDADVATEATTAAGAGLTDTWTGLGAPVAADTATIAISTTGVVSVVTTFAHLLVSGDTITMANATAGIALSAEAASRTVTRTGAKTFTYKVSETTGLLTAAIAATTAAGGDEYTLTTYAGPQGLVDRVGAETYTVKATIAGTASGNLVTTSVVAAVSPVPYAGPLVTNLAQRSVAVDSDEVVVITGTRLNLVASLNIDGKPCVVVSQSDGQLAIKLPVGLTAGLKDLKILYGGGATATHQNAFLITAGDSAAGSSSPKVNTGSFKGYVALYALNHEGQRLSAKVGNDWVIVESIPAAVNNLYRHVEFTGVGYEIQVRIFIDRELEATIPLLTK